MQRTQFKNCCQKSLFFRFQNIEFLRHDIGGKIIEQIRSKTAAIQKLKSSKIQKRWCEFCYVLILNFKK